MTHSKSMARDQSTGSGPLRLEWRDPDDLAENPRNWRRHPQAQTAALKDVIAEVGWAGALLYNERTGRLIDGHARKKVVAKGEMVPVLIGDWSDADEAKILATLDPLAAMAERDEAALAALVASVETDSEALAEMLTGPAFDDVGEVPLAGDPGDRDPFETMSFTLADDQVATVRAALASAKDVASGETFTNGNGNGNALFVLAREYLGAQG
jgi:hypothetical protein